MDKTNEPGSNAPENGEGDDALRPEGLRALQAERESNKKLREQLKELSDWKEAQEAAGKSETEKLAAEAEKLRADNASFVKDALRLRVAMKKGLTEKQAARLVGDDEESLLADADDLLTSFKQAEPESDANDLNRRPVEDLKGGSRPNEEIVEMDPAKLAAEISAISQ